MNARKGRNTKTKEKVKLFMKTSVERKTVGNVYVAKEFERQQTQRPESAISN